MSSSDTPTLEAADPHISARREDLRSAWIRRVLGVVAAWSGGWWLLLGALLAPALPGRWSTVVLAAGVLAFLPLLFLGRALAGVYPSAAVRLLVFRPFWYMQLAVPLMASAGLIAFLAAAPFGLARRGGQIAPLGAAAVIAAGALAGYVGSRRLRIVNLEARFSSLPQGLEGLRIAQVSDLHVGPHTPARHLERIVRAVQSARPDIIAITGDQVDDYAQDVEHFAQAFSTFHAPLGVFAVPGNHDVYAGWPEVRAGLEAMGMTVLVNDAHPLVRNGDRFWIAGTGDPAGVGLAYGAGGEAAPDIGRTLSRVPAGAFTVALAHNPALWPYLAERGVHLTLSGHTHHGQFSIPTLGWSLASLFLEHAMGSHRRGPSLLYINPGTNYWGLPLRIGALPEVTIFTLRRAQPG
jgi:predicted MPP superfamily phosphohydrolase